jgi:hypothetical protein
MGRELVAACTSALVASHLHSFKCTHMHVPFPRLIGQDRGGVTGSGPMSSLREHTQVCMLWILSRGRAIEKQEQPVRAGKGMGRVGGRM